MSLHSTLIVRIACRLTIAAGALTPMGCSEGHPPTTEGAPTLVRDVPIASSDDGGAAATPSSPISAGNLTTSPSDAGSPAADGSPADDAGTAIPQTVCNPKMTLGEPTFVAAAAVRFGSISDDERTIAWAIPTNDNDVGVAKIAFADRASPSDAFGAPVTLNETVARDGIAVSPDGTMIVAVAPNKKHFVVFERFTRTDAFAEGDAYAFDDIHASLAADERVGDPVFAFGDLVFLFSVYGGASSGADTVRFAPRLSSGSTFGAGSKLALTELRAQAGKRRRPSGIGADFQTLFFWDEVTETQKLGHLQGTAGFYSVADLGAARPWAQPNRACTRVYFGTSNVGSAQAQ